MKTQVTIWGRDPAAAAYGDEPDPSYAGRAVKDEIYAERNDGERARKIAGVIGGFGLACGYCGVCIGTGMWSAIAFWFGISAVVASRFIGRGICDMSSALAEIAIKRGERRFQPQSSRFLDTLYEIETWGDCIRNADGFRQWHGTVKGERFCASVHVHEGQMVVRFISLKFDSVKSRRVLVVPSGRMVLECDGCPVYTENKYFGAVRKLSEAIDRLPQ